MPSQADINAARQHSDATHTTAMGLSAEEGASAPVMAAPNPSMNLFTAAFGEFAAVPVAGGEEAIQGEKKISSIHFDPLF